ncbi:ABC transporter permease [uncultured Parabacteroides sp.]|uniref:ABC transporter permease n=1 Tax=uncultured Parabacteroides sp. TaxID=512312 RepID=UPI002675770A|nr:ABC transporter permease [uncultured Parabacteroides sp.]
MIKQYFKQAIRLLTENKLLSVISILGTALAICMIMVIVILYIVNTAGFKPEVNRGRSYYFNSVMSEGKEDGRRISYGNIGLPFIRGCYYPLKSAELVTAVIRDDWSKQPATSMDGLNNYSSRIIETDPAFWKFFDFDFIGGAPFTQANFESGIREAVLSESVARTLFGSEQAVGKEIKLDFTVFRVCGVVKDVSRFAKKSYADIWIPYTAASSYEQSWDEGISGMFCCYVLLKEGCSRTDLKQEVDERVRLYNSGLSDYRAKIFDQPNSQIEEWMYASNVGQGGAVAKVYLRYAIILFVLLLVPALNLSGIPLSRMRKRIAELGVRRAFGATKGNIIGQVLMENLVLTLAGGLLGLCLSYVAMWLLRDWLLVTSLGEAGLSMNMLNGYVFLAALFFCLVMNLMSAGIPAWRVSRVNITNSING